MGTLRGGGGIKNLPAEGDGRLTLGIELHRVEGRVDVASNNLVGKGVGIELFAPAAPVGIHVHEYRARLGLAELCGLLKGDPLDGWIVLTLGE